MKYLISVLLTALMVWSINAFACYGYYSSEQISGMNKICWYNHLGSNAAYTVAIHQLCPRTINVRH